MKKFNPLDHPICFSYPLRVVPSSWIEHVPFAMFLVDAVKPKLLVELGTALGVSYCAFCQAIKELGLETRGYAIDTFAGDSQTGYYTSDVLDELRRHHDPLYSSFSTIIQSTFDEALLHFEDGTIDLLHIDGFHTYDAVKHDFENWLPKMSAEGVMLFHDINVRERDFGAWRLWDELKAKYPHVDFAHEHGLGLLIVGRPPAGLSEFLSLKDTELIRAREFFYQLGLRLRNRVAKDEETHNLHTKIVELQNLLAQKDGQIGQKEREIGERLAQKEGEFSQRRAQRENEFAAEAAKTHAGWERIVKGHADQIVVLNQKVEALTKTLKEKEKALNKVSVELSDKSQQLIDLTRRQIVMTRDSLAVAARLRMKEKHAEQLNAQFVEQRYRLTAELDEQKRLNAELVETLQALDSNIKHLSGEIDDRDQLLQTVSQELTDRNDRLNKIENSVSGKLLKKYGKFKYRRLMPLYRIVHLAPRENGVNPEVQSDSPTATMEPSGSVDEEGQSESEGEAVAEQLVAPAAIPAAEIEPEWEDAPAEITLGVILPDDGLPSTDEINKFSSEFGNHHYLLLKTSDGVLQVLPGTNHPETSFESLPITHLYEPQDWRRRLSSDHLRNALLSLKHTGADFVIVSNTLTLLPIVAITSLQDAMVYSRSLGSSLAENNLSTKQAVGRVLRLVPATHETREVEFSELVPGAVVDYQTDQSVICLNREQ